MTGALANKTTRNTVWSVRIWSFSGPNAGKCGPEELRIRILFTQCKAAYNWKFAQRHFIASNKSEGSGGYFDNFCKLKYSIEKSENIREKRDEQL